MFNSLINNFNLTSIKISFFYFRYGVFVIAIATFLEFDDKFIKYFFNCICFCFIILIIDGFYQYFTGKNVLGFVTPNSYRVSSFFNNNMILGSYLSRLWPIFFGLATFLFKKKDKLYFLFVLIFILSWALIFLSGERAAFFYINFSIIFVILFSQKLPKLKIIMTMACGLLLIIIISYFNSTAKERMINQTLSQINLTQYNKQNIKEPIIFSIEHTHHYIAAYKMFLDNKFLGVGVKNFRKFCDDENYVSEFSCSTHPHNTYIQILSEIGIVGFLFLIFVLFYFCKYIIKHLLFIFKGQNYFTDFEICILSGISIYLWPFIPTGNIFNNWLNIAMILNFPFLIWSKKVLKKN